MRLMQKLQASTFAHLPSLPPSPPAPTPRLPLPLLQISRLHRHKSLGSRKPDVGLTHFPPPELELYRLEQRYTRRSKRTTFISDATYVDGEYIYASTGTNSPAISPLASPRETRDRWFPKEEQR